MKKTPQDLSQMNRNALVQGKFNTVNEALFKSGLSVGEIGQILKELDRQLGSVRIGEPNEEKNEPEKKTS